MTEEKEDNYIFGSSLGNKMMGVSQIFILRSIIASLSLLVLADLAGSIYAIFFTDISMFMKIVSAISGIFGAILMSAIVIMTFQQYKTFIEIDKVKKIMEENVELFGIPNTCSGV
jgi:hypothetical protein